MAEMEQSFADEHPRNHSNEHALELQRWQQWRDTSEPTGTTTATGVGGTGSAARPIEIDGGSAAAAETTSTRPNGRETGGGDAPVEETETLWGHAVHEHELSAGDQVRHAWCARCSHFTRPDVLLLAGPPARPAVCSGLVSPGCALRIGRA